MSDETTLRLPDGFAFSTDTGDIDRQRVHAWLSSEAYWAIGRTRQVQDAAIDGSRNFGIFRDSTGEQVAYARVVTDGVTFAWLADVFVDAGARGLGLGTVLIAKVCADLERCDLNRIALVTSDAHSLYSKFGFAPLAAPGRWMAKERVPA